MSSSRHGSTPTSPKAIPRPASQQLAADPGLAAGAANGSSAGSLGAEGFVTPPAGGSPLAPWRSPVGRVESSPARLSALPPGSPLGKLPLAPGQEPAGEEGGSQAGDTEGPGAAAAGQPGLGLPEGLPPLLSPDYAVNAFVTRLCFDLLRRPDFQVRWVGPGGELAFAGATAGWRENGFHGGSCQGAGWLCPGKALPPGAMPSA